ncbi:hypothetical protein JZ751_000163 [Albula glossodonta]|uniref:Dolichol-phosphate mannosyltransferase subunit 3 n=1 Tax=Albula glossodonta TaxID=121402 RepID=A0A8T2PVH0_9TELE|nr:hypothetical protein JZ751_000163 [Albula glossodonta]
MGRESFSLSASGFNTQLRSAQNPNLHLQYLCLQPTLLPMAPTSSLRLSFCGAGFLTAGTQVPQVGKELRSIMTKLLQWLLGVSVLGLAWGLLTFDLLDLQLPHAYREVVWPMPVYLLVVFGCYSLATVGFRVATFNDCEEAAKELQAQIQEAKLDLQKKGLKF